jgi:acyl-coenzyme A synthetase/AMP-(fatty) acid ligase
MNAIPAASFYNGYGPTEATGISMCHRVDRIPEPGEKIPIGRPCKGARIAVLGEDGLQVRPGEIGELCIAGPGLAKGYLHDPQKTRKCFTPPPPGCDLEERIYWTGDLVQQTPQGDYVFVSRKDCQVKWMGYRIELNEIEYNLTAYPQIGDAAVLLANAGKDGLTELVSFLETEREIDPSVLCQFLEKRLPLYMIPKRFIRLDPLPRSDRGKIAREEILRRYAEWGNMVDARAR